MPERRKGPLKEIPLDMIHRGFIDALEDWAKWTENRDDEALEHAAELSQFYLHIEGLGTPGEPVSAAEVEALGEMVEYFDSIRKISPQTRRGMMKALGISDSAIISEMQEPKIRPGWEYLKRAFGLDVIAPSVEGLLVNDPTGVQSVETMAEFEERLFTDNLGENSETRNEYISPAEAQHMTYFEYEAAESTLDGGIDGGGVLVPSEPVTPGSGGDPVPGEGSGSSEADAGGTPGAER